MILPVFGMDNALNDGVSGTTVKVDISFCARDFSFGPPSVSRMVLKLSTAVWQANNCLPEKRGLLIYKINR